MFFKKKEADDEYELLKQQALDEFEKLQNGNPFENPSITRDKWNAEYENIKKVYKLSKKYSNTIDDVELLKNLKKQSKEKWQFFTHEAEALEYKNEVVKITREFEDFNEKMEYDENLDDIENWYQSWKNLYENAEKLYKKKFMFLNDGFDEEGLDKAYFGAKYYYAAYMYKLIYLGTENDAQSEVLRKQECLKLCLKVLHGSGNELKFHVLRGHIYFMQGELWKEYAEVFGVSDDEKISKLTTERNHAYPELRRIEEDTDASVHSLNTIEWYFYKSAVYELYSYYLYNKKDLDKAHDLIEKEIPKYDISISMGIGPTDFVEDLKKELSLFQKGFLGWKYIG